MKKTKPTDFIQQLQECKKSFLKRSSQYGKVDETTFEIDICKFYFTMRVEGEDEEGDSFACEQEFELADENVYQNEIIPLNFFVD